MRLAGAAVFVTASALSPRGVQLRAVPDARVCPKCAQPRRVGRLPEHLEEISGFASSTQHAGVFYAVVDSPEVPQVFVLNESGGLLQTLNISGAEYPKGFDFGSTHQGDWETAATGTCLLGSSATVGAGACVFIGDTGHNCARPSQRGCADAPPYWRRDKYRILQIREPAVVQAGQPFATIGADQAWFRFANNESFDVESLMAAPDGQLYVATKEDSGISRIFSVPITDEASSDAPVLAKPLGQIEVPELRAGHGVTHVGKGTAWVTGASMAQQNGTATGFSLRTPRHVLFFPLDNDTDISSAMAGQVPCELPSHMFPQSESVTWEKQNGTAYYLTSEGSRDLYKVDCGVGARSESLRPSVQIAFGCVAALVAFLF